MDDLFSQRPKDDDIEAKRRHARGCFYRLVGRWPKTPEERAEIRLRKYGKEIDEQAREQ